MRWLWGALAAGALSLSGCGSGGAGSSAFVEDDGGAPAFDATAVGNLIPDATVSSQDAGACTPRTCDQAGANCGPVADGCGGLLACGDCGSGQSCGGGGTPSVCGGGPVCVPKTCADPTVSGLCGQQSDGCGGLIPQPCVVCSGLTTCGGGGTANACGGTQACVPLTESAACVVPGTNAVMNCGVMGDGCGNLVSCTPDGGAGCPSGEECGGGGVSNVCGASNVTTQPDGAVTITDGGVSLCVPFTQSAACAAAGGGSLCGPVSNGCGGQITCPACTVTGDTCGGGGTHSVCGHPICQPIPQATACANPEGGTYCGQVSDGCGNAYTCPVCTVTGDTCGGGSVASVCGQPKCTKLTACPNNPTNNLPYNCGPWPDGCGGTISCGTCMLPNICGGGGPGTGSQCGDSVGDAGAFCDAGLKCDFPACDGGTNTTSLKGVILDPAGNNPLYNVVVYVPNTTPDFPLTHGASCADCSSLYTGDPVSATTTGTDGTFTLTNVPVPASGRVPLVIQVGKWRRQMIWENVTPCATNTASGETASLLRLPGKESATTGSPTTLPDGGTSTVDELPQIAVSTGGADSMECLFQRIGFDPSEYTSGSTDGGVAHGHIHIFQGSSTSTELTAARGPGTTTPSSLGTLWNSTADLDPYDIVILSCEGEETRGNGGSNQLSAGDLSHLSAYATAGGRVFASHFHYAWLNGTAFLGSTGLTIGTWVPATDAPVSGAGVGDYSDPIYDTASDDILNATVVTTTADGGPFARGAAMKAWLGNATVDALGVNGAPANELNISNPRFNVTVTKANTPSQAWLVPDNKAYTYTDHTQTSQTLPASTQYMSFDTPVGGIDAGADAGATYCGRVVYSDLHVGAASGDYAGWEAGTAPTAPTYCASGPLSPQEKALEFMLLDLASCVSSDSNLPTQPTPTCTPLTACPAQYVCGSYPNGCGTDGGLLDCGTCPTNSDCVNGQCVACVPITTCPAGVKCGDIPNGCGGIVSCGNCSVTQACINGTCSTGCTPATQCPNGVTCGVAPDGCGGVVQCGVCTTPGDTCGGGGVNGVCGQGDADVCVKYACATFNPPVQCGPAGDGCGGQLDCGPCNTAAGQSCGGGGVHGVCGAPNCTPKTCTDLGANCGQVADGCGGVTAVCGTCTGNDTCGGGGTTNVCGVPACTPRTCVQAGANCGPVADGCGNVLQCGDCTSPSTCGGSGIVSVCGSGGPK
jgi:hypothetical protein